MSNLVKAWTKQHENILDDLQATGRYIVQKKYIINKMEEHSGVYLDAYEWYYREAGKLVPPPIDAKYPIWLTLTEEGRIENSPGNVELELLVPKEKLITMELEKWGRVVNLMYIPANAQDAKEHESMLMRYGVDDSTAYMSAFYPNIKQKIIKSWRRLFDEGTSLGRDRLGTVWELRKDWIAGIIK